VIAAQFGVRTAPPTGIRHRAGILGEDVSTLKSSGPSAHRALPFFVADPASAVLDRAATTLSPAPAFIGSQVNLFGVALSNRRRPFVRKTICEFQARESRYL